MGNKRGMLDDFFDFIFTVVVFFFILLFVQGFIVRGADEREAASNSLVAKTEHIETYLSIQQERVQAGQLVQQDELDEFIRNTRLELGTIPFPERTVEVSE